MIAQEERLAEAERARAGRALDGEGLVGGLHRGDAQLAVPRGGEELAVGGLDADGAAVLERAGDVEYLVALAGGGGDDAAVGHGRQLVGAVAGLDAELRGVRV